MAATVANLTLVATDDISGAPLTINRTSKPQGRTTQFILAGQLGHSYQTYRLVILHAIPSQQGFSAGFLGIPLGPGMLGSMPELRA